jgi:heme O synthase-like polyprenyltransferase
VPQEVKKFYRKIPKPRVATLLTVVFTLAWIVASVAEYRTRGEVTPYQAPSSLDPLMLIVAGAYITNMAVVEKRSAAKNNEEESQ